MPTVMTANQAVEMALPFHMVYIIWDTFSKTAKNEEVKNLCALAHSLRNSICAVRCPKKTFERIDWVKKLYGKTIDKKYAGKATLENIAIMYFEFYEWLQPYLKEKNADIFEMLKAVSEPLFDLIAYNHENFEKTAAAAQEQNCELVQFLQARGYYV